MEHADQTIGFVGIGTMGWPMAANLIKDGFIVLGYDVDPEKRRRFAAEFDMPEVDSLARIGREARAVITMLPTGTDVRHVMLEAEGRGLTEMLAPGSLAIDMSSADPVGTRDLGRIMAQRSVTLIDAPVSGGEAGAIAGTLTIMIGGDAAAIERAQPILKAMGQRLFLTGALGTGHAMKALNNFLLGVGFASAVEAILVGQRFGLDPETMMDIMNVSTGRNFATEMFIKQNVLSRAFKSNFSLGLLTKDVGIASTLADTLGVVAPLSHLIYDLLVSARDELGPTADHTAAILAWEKRCTT